MRTKRKSRAYCGVRQCNTYKSNEISMHKIWGFIKSSEEKKKWMDVLKMDKEFPKQFVICSLHFEKRHLLHPAERDGVKTRVRLSTKAFPCKNLPQSNNKVKKRLPRTKRMETSTDTDDEDEYYGHVEDIFCDSLPEVPPLFRSVEVQCDQINSQDKGSQCDKIDFKNEGSQCNSLRFIYATSLWDTDRKLNTMTGIPSFTILEAMIKSCKLIRPNENFTVSLKDKILLTLHRLKSNSSIAELAIRFQISEKDVSAYFTDCIQALSKVMKGLLYWQPREKTPCSLPKCFQPFPNVVTVLDCIEIKSVPLECLTCGTCTCSHYKVSHKVKVLLGVSPSGLINFISTAVVEKASDKAVFNLTDLTNKLQLGDAVMVDEGFLIGNELAMELADVDAELIRPAYAFQKLPKKDVERNTLISLARVHIEKRMERMKTLQIFSQRIESNIFPHIDDVMTVICGLSNICQPIIKDDTI